MSSTNVHSNKYLHICGGQTIPQEPSQSFNMPPKSAKRAIDKIEVIEGEKGSITAHDNIVVKDSRNKGKVVGRAAMDGTILSGDSQAVKKALADKDMEK